MSKYKLQLGAFVTRMVQRTIIVHASSEEEAIEKAENKYWEIEAGLQNGGDVGAINVDSIEEIP